jgi:hypothetical protein
MFKLVDSWWFWKYEYSLRQSLQWELRAIASRLSTSASSVSNSKTNHVPLLAQIFPDNTNHYPNLHPWAEKDEQTTNTSPSLLRTNPKTPPIFHTQVSRTYASSHYDANVQQNLQHKQNVESGWSSLSHPPVLFMVPNTTTQSTEPRIKQINGSGTAGSVIMSRATTVGKAGILLKGVQVSLFGCQCDWKMDSGSSRFVSFEYRRWCLERNEFEYGAEIICLWGRLSGNRLIWSTSQGRGTGSSQTTRCLESVLNIVLRVFMKRRWTVQWVFNRLKRAKVS